MKKYLVKGAVALAMCLTVVSCSQDVYDESLDADVANYETAFKKHFGVPAANQDWGFGTYSNPTRSVTIGGDVYNMFTLPTAAELTAAFPAEIPADADEVKDLATLEKYQNSTYNNGNLYFIYLVNGGGHNYKITATESDGTVTIGGTWANSKDAIYNVYVRVNGNVTLKRNGTEYMNLYIMEGNVTLDSNFGECGGLIAVAPGATLNDNRSALAHNGGIKVFNRGTFNTGGDYMIGNNAYIFNEKTFDVNGVLNYNPGSGNTPYFFNRGDDVSLTADSFILDSEGGFISDGTVNISGETKVTQQGIVWVNNGHYTTGSLTFSAKNCTFYNYCQLIVTNTCKFLDGEFNMMTGSYAQIGAGLFNNFIVNMANNSGMNILNGTKWGRQAQGTFQGFRAVNDAAQVYVRLGGQNYVPSHNGGAFHVQGANLTLAYNDMKFYKNYNTIDLYSEFTGISYWDETTAEALELAGDGNITWDLHNVTKLVTGDIFASTGFSTTPGQCAATWNGPGGGPEPFIPVARVMCEDLSAEDGSDFDFNDVVFSIQWTSTGAKIRLEAAGGTLPLTVGGVEVHAQFQVGTQTMVNTLAGHKNDYEKPIFELTGNFKNAQGDYDANLIPVLVFKHDEWKEMTAIKGRAASKICVDPQTDWCDEYQDIDDKWNGQFSEWVQGNRATFY